MNINPTDELEQIGRIISRLKTYKIEQRVTTLCFTKDEYMKQHLTEEDWKYWLGTVKNELTKIGA
ncbi:hypothetical protein GCM10027085_21240 [Spirosoma aerophilum]